MDQQAEKDKTERVTGLCRRTRQEIVKWNQVTALRFQTGGDIRHLRPPWVGGGTNRDGDIIIHTGSCGDEDI